MRVLPYLWILNLVLLIDWAKNRRPAFWLFALVTLGPLGALAYLIYYYEDINFPIRLAATVRKLSGGEPVRPCPRCGTVTTLISHTDGRQEHFMCRTCVERTFLEPHKPWEAVDAAAKLIQDTTKPEE